MDISIIGLGKMGLSYAKNLNRNGYEVSGFDIDREIGLHYNHPLFKSCSIFEELLSKSNRNLVFLFLPAGNITDNMIKKLLPYMNADDIIVDCANGHYNQAVQHRVLASQYQVSYYDCGISGGMKGALEGACMMMGGTSRLDDELRKIIESTCVEGGFLYHPSPGSGHYLKMVHNGIEYGMMQSIAEGLELLAKQDHYDYNLEEVTANWSNGSIIASLLIDCIHERLVKDKELQCFTGPVHASGEGKWTIQEALEQEVPVPTIALALMKRNATLDKNAFSNRVISAMRYEFGGHNENSHTS
ncbi:NADP-dependent phosphogluconate dehydrogenase [Streptococcus sp.]|uniref:NADP-dependent phosphogluconate dehydrogenase n=1 Tax=Streptococcus sp. TaxID=1306 RepID=UPI0035A0C4D2